MENLHQPVLIKEALDCLRINPDGIYIDTTFGRGGHSQAILEQLSTKGRLIALDQDPEAADYARQFFQTEPRFKFEKINFNKLKLIADKLEVNGAINGILFDLGLCSPQLDTASRGFSFTQDGLLDMRMDPTSGRPIWEWLNKASLEEIADVLFYFGEERQSRKLSYAIGQARRITPIITTHQLVNVITRVIPHYAHKHPATRTFQALRIFANQELESLKSALYQAGEILAAQGRLVVISFHSLEDRIVKRFIRDYQSVKKSTPWDVPVDKPLPFQLQKVISFIRVSAHETKLNPRSRSAILRCAEKQS